MDRTVLSPLVVSFLTLSILILCVVAADSSPVLVSNTVPGMVATAGGGGDPDITRNFTELVTSKGYPCETHKVVTQDGYILTVFRIPHGKNRPAAAVAGPPVLLWHGLLVNSFSWIMNEANESLAFILSDLGYDVWMGNSRGNVYSFEHQRLSPKDHEFWQFSYDEQARYDVPNTIDYVLSVSTIPEPKKIAYVGHSQGTLQAFAAFSLDPSLADRVSVFVAMGPVVSAYHIQSKFLRYLADLHVDKIFELLGVDRFLPSTEWLRDKLPEFCRSASTNRLLTTAAATTRDLPLQISQSPGICQDVLSVLFGPPNPNVMNTTRLPVYIGHTVGGTSVKNMVHWTQNVRVNSFQMFDYGAIENQRHYNSTTPPTYDLNSRFPPTLPVGIFYGGKDQLADPEDVLALIANLPTKPKLIKEMPDYTHLDFVWDMQAAAEIYPLMIELLHTYLPTVQQ